LMGAGFVHYEVANWARERSLASQHNTIYWRNGEYLGLGAGAHGRVGGRRVMNHLLPATYRAAIEAGATPVSNVEELSAATSMSETMMLGLRLLREGISAEAFAARHGVLLEEVYGEVIGEMVGIGLLERSGDGIRLTHRGLMLANDVCGRFL